MWWLRIFGFKAFSFCEALGFLVVISFFYYYYYLWEILDFIEIKANKLHFCHAYKYAT